MQTHIYSGHEFSDGKLVAEGTLSRLPNNNPPSLPVANFATTKAKFRRTTRTAVEKSISRYEFKRLTLAERAKRATAYLATVDKKLSPIEFISLDAFLSDVRNFETVAARTAELLSAERPALKRAEKGMSPKIHRREVGREGTQAKQTKRRKPVADHAVGKNANLIRKGYDDAKQNAVVWCLENNLPANVVNDETHPQHKLAWHVGWRRHVKSVQFARCRERTFAVDIDTLSRIEYRQPTRLTFAKIRKLCQLTTRDKTARLITYLYLLEYKQTEIAARLEVSLSTVEKSLRTIRQVWNRANNGEQFADIIS